MAPVTNGRELFNEIVPAGELPTPGKTTVYDTSETIDFDTVPLNGGFLVKTLALSMDPLLLPSMRAPQKGQPMPPFPIGKPIMGVGIGVVLRSEHEGVEVGSHAYGALSHQEYSIVPTLKNPMQPVEIIKKNPKLSWTAQLGPTGLAGETAFCGWKEHSKAKKGETVFVSSGAGGVGSIVVQLAKKDGLKVIASAGTDAKVKFLKEIGADVAFNYKTTDTREVLAKEGPLDIYWDNVGGETFNAAIEATKMNARLIICGQITNFNGTNQPIKVAGLFNARSLTMVGFNMFFLRYKHMAAFRGEYVPQVANGEFKYAEDIRHGLANAGEALLHALSGENVGKVSVIVAEE